MALSTAQQRALAKATSEWQSAYELQESISTLNALVRVGLLQKRCTQLGSFYDARNADEYRKVKVIACGK